MLAARTILIILGCAGMGVLLASATGQSQLAGYLATSPGGLFAVLAIAAETDTSATFVLAVQVLRIFVMLLVAPGDSVRIVAPDDDRSRQRFPRRIGIVRRWLPGR